MEKSFLVTKPMEEYELLDSGREEKLERFGKFILARPDPQALWERRLPEHAWRAADAQYERKGNEGKWRIKARDYRKSDSSHSAASSFSYGRRRSST